MKSNFEDLEVFKSAIDLMVEVYRSTAAFPADERFGLTTQMRRASVSIVSHIAEGQGRFLYGEWRQMLSQGRGSLFEIEAQCIAANRLQFLSDEAFAELRQRTRQTGRLLAGLVKYVRRRELEEKAKKR